MGLRAAAAVVAAAAQNTCICHWPEQAAKKKSVKMKLGDKLAMYYNEEVRLL